MSDGVAATHAARPALRRELGLFSVAAIIFFNVSGGPYGIEDMVPAFGPGLTLLLLIITPLVWSLPVSLAMAELATAMPDEGGYVTWTRRAFGPFWSFQVGWWSWLDSFLDVAVYPALFVDYLRFWFPAITPIERWLLAVAFIVVLTALNVLGVRPVGRVAAAFAAVALAPVALFVAVGAGALATGPWPPLLPEGESLGAGLGLGLAVVMWNYSGWDTPSTTLGETRGGGRTFRRASFIALPIITAAYVLPLAVGLGNGAIAWKEWDTGTLPTVAVATGGAWLGHAVGVGAVISTAGLFMTLLLTNSRVPYVLGRDGQLPAAFAVVHERLGTPWVAVLASAVCYGAFAVFSFKELIVLNVWLYSLTLLVELAAFLWLRRAEPELVRPWRVPGGWPGAVLVAVAPALLALFAMATAGWLNTLAGLTAAATGPLAWLGMAVRAERIRCARRAVK